MRGLGWPLTRGIGQWQPARTLTTAPISSSEGWNIIGDNISQVLMAQNTIPISRCEFQGYYHCLTFWPSLLQIVVFGILKGYKPQYHHHGVLVPEQQQHYALVVPLSILGRSRAGRLWGVGQHHPAKSQTHNKLSLLSMSLLSWLWWSKDHGRFTEHPNMNFPWEIALPIFFLWMHWTHFCIW